jgi:hypothetical protein
MLNDLGTCHGVARLAVSSRGVRSPGQGSTEAVWPETGQMRAGLRRHPGRQSGAEGTTSKSGCPTRPQGLHVAPGREDDRRGKYPRGDIVRLGARGSDIAALPVHSRVPALGGAGALSGADGSAFGGRVLANPWPPLPGKSPEERSLLKGSDASPGARRRGLDGMERPARDPATRHGAIDALL